MRIIGGHLSGRRFGAPAGRGTRPTSDRVREALGSALASRDAFTSARVLDLFAGSGALSFEALSRGAKSATLADIEPRAIREIQQSARTLGVEAQIKAIRIDLLAEPSIVVDRLAPKSACFDLLFADAPYAKINAVLPLIEALMATERLAPGAWVVVEHPATHAWEWTKGLASEAEYRYGRTLISLGVNEQKGIT